ncbi:MAG: hypothetical protein ACM3PT_14010 [Deltaproteobacteria bacterium]
MLISVFKRNLFINSLLLLPLAALVRVFALIFPEKTATSISGGILYKLVLNIIPDNQLFHTFLSIFLVFFMAVLINRLVIKNRIANEITLLPGLFFILLVSIIPEMLSLSAISFATLLIILAFSNLYKSYKKFNAEIYLFNIGLYTAVAVLFCNNIIVYTVIFILGFISIRTFNLRELMQILAGLLIVFYFYAFYLFWSGDSYTFTPFTFNSIKEYFSDNLSVYIITLIYGSIIIVILSTYRRFTIKKSIQSQKKVNILFWYILLSIIAMWIFSPEFRFGYFYLIAFGLSYFTSAIFLRIKNKMILEVVYLIIIFSIWIYHSRYYF